MASVFNTLAPVFLVISLGYGLARRGFLSPSVLTELNRLLFWISLPALIVSKLAGAGEFPAGTGAILLVFTTATVAVIGLGFLAARLLKLEKNRVGTFVQAVFRGNLAYTGIPIILFALQNRSPETASATMAQTLFVFAPTMLLYNAAAVILLTDHGASSLGENFGKMLKKIATNPLILASAVGVLLFLLPFPLPSFALNTLDLVGQLAAPAALLCVGGSMAFVSMEGRYRSATVATLLKTAVLPALAALLAIPFALGGTSLLVLLVLSACPTAVTSYIMAKEMGGDEALASGAIVLSTILSLPALAVILALVA